MDKTPFRDQYEAIKNKQQYLEALMLEQDLTVALMRRRRRRLMLVYCMLMTLSVCVGIWVF
ncbi:hypothetical protein N9L24_03310 [Candidatus Marinamargulisbacteria bacterium]|jgi:type IV secretory pathway component VirB8|nr:hypothetical protein [Candidatus Marinamargulisbacteria bacterium]